MSWRRFCNLYRALGPHSLVARNYDRLARRCEAPSGAWQALTALPRPKGR